MLKRVLLAVLLVSVLLCFMGSALGENGVSFNYGGDDVKFYTADSSIKEEKVYDLSPAEFKQYLKDNNILIYGTNESGTLAFNLTCNQTDFSKDLGNYATLDDADVILLTATLDLGEGSVVSINGNKYYCVEKSLENLIMKQYVTVHNGKLYVLTVNTDNSNINKALGEQIINSLKISTPKANDTLNYAFIIFFTVIIGIVLLLTAISLVKQIKNR